jgi:glucose/arabinose dehydrogenase
MTLRRSVMLFLVLALALTATPAKAAPTVVAVPVAIDLAFPTAFDFTPGGRIFYTERYTGNIRIFNPSSGSNTLFYQLPNLVDRGEEGLLGIALHPRYPDRPLVYAYYTRQVGDTVQAQIVRLRNEAGTGTLLKVILRLPAADHHVGGVIHFGPDGNLYAVVGEHNDPAEAQDLSSYGGKVLRMRPNGRVPSTNPFPDSLIWSYGHRNMFGFDFDPLAKGRIWLTENGPECNDEINLVRKGLNYGWGPSETCSSPPDPPANTNQDGPSPVMPLAWYTPTVAFTGGVFCNGCHLGSAAEGSFLAGAFKGGDIRMYVPTANRLGIAFQSILYHHPPSFGVLALERGPDGSVYFSDGGRIFRLELSS